MKVGYIRTSKKDQNPELQRRDLLAAGCEKIFDEQISSRKADRPEMRAASEFCRQGDEFVVWKLDRFGRSLQELIELVGVLKERGVEFVSLRESGLTPDERTISAYATAASSIVACSYSDGLR
jgi:DNA invertase Pin-like site-specific DNA recombinase